jgi:fatty acid desaturase
MATTSGQQTGNLIDTGGAKRLAALRDALAPFKKRRTGAALGLFAGDVLLLAAGQALVVFGPGILLRILGSLITWIGIVRLFLIGHDACHGALTDSDRLNSVIGRLAFLPSLTPFSLWHVGHNVVHHGFNNLRGRDFVWEPKSPEDYRNLSRWRRALERLYRSAAGPAPYYFLEIWWKRLYFPGLARLKTRRWQFIADCTAVTRGGRRLVQRPRLGRQPVRCVYLAARRARPDPALLPLDLDGGPGDLPAPHGAGPALVRRPA